MRQVSHRSLLALALTIGGLLLGGASCSASIIQFAGALEPQAAGPPVPTGTGYSMAIVNTVARTLYFETQWSGLNSTVSASHIHAKGGVTPFVYPTSNWAVALNMSGIPTGTSGFFSKNYGIADLGSGYVRQENGLAGTVTVFTTAERELAFDNLVTYLGSGQAYFNLHTSGANPGGSLANFYHVVPEPGSVALMAVVFSGFGYRALRARRRRACASVA
jgi:hypothetical protein